MSPFRPEPSGKHAGIYGGDHESQSEPAHTPISHSFRRIDSFTMGQLFSLIRQLVAEEKYVVGRHASARLDERGILE